MGLPGIEQALPDYHQRRMLLNIAEKYDVKDTEWDGWHNAGNDARVALEIQRQQKKHIWTYRQTTFLLLKTARPQFEHERCFHGQVKPGTCPNFRQVADCRSCPVHYQVFTFMLKVFLNTGTKRVLTVHTAGSD